MNNSSLAGLYQSTNSSTSTLRPRAARLISYVEDESNDHRNDATGTSTSSSSTTPPFPSRGVSPNPATARSNSAGKPKPPRGSKGSLSGPQNLTGGNQALWEPWSSLQDFASTLLGSDAASASKDKPATSIKTPLWMKQDKLFGNKSTQQQWGPSLESSSNAPQDAIEERKAKVQAKRREALLLASVTEGRDSMGRFKRRDSDAAPSATTPIDSGEDALVYVHRVQKGETLAGVIIKYNCHPESFRKINRFWPNDDIQVRTHVLIPVEICNAKGRKIDSPYLSQDLFDPGKDHVGIHTPPTSAPRETGSSSANGLHGGLQSSMTMPSSFSTEPSSLTTPSEEFEFKHESWVLLPNFSEAIEVLRVPRRALGYFPRARRKSNATIANTSLTSTPKTSFDMLRHPPTHAAQTSASLNVSPVRRPMIPSRLNSGRQRSSSASGGSGNTFVDALRGPGGVGTLRGLRTEAAKPGPADDPLNRKFAQYFPDLFPAEEMPRTGFSTRPAARATPRASTDSARSTRSNSNGSGLGEVGGAIEGWVRKIAHAKRERNAAVDKMGDLIELETTSESPPHLASTSSSGARAHAPTPTATSATGSGGGDYDNTSTTTTLSASAADEALLNERFPIRGRVKTAYASSSSMGKNKGD